MIAETRLDPAASGLLPHGPVGKHGCNHFSHAGPLHGNTLIAQTKGSLFAPAGGNPSGKFVSIIWVSGSNKTAQIIHHLIAELIVTLFHGSPAVGQRTKPVP